MRSKKAIYNILTNLILQFIVLLYGFIVPKIIISNFGSDVNGLVTSITQFLAYITLLESGFGPVVKSILYKPISEKNNDEIANILKTSEKFFRKIALIFIIYIAVLSIFYPLLIKNEFSFLFTISLIIIISISTFAEYFFGMTYRLFLQAEQKTYIISIIQIFTYILAIISIIILANFGANIHIIKLITGIIFVIRPIVQNIYVKKKYNISFKNVDDNYKLKNKWDGLAQHVAAVIHSNTDVIVLTFFCSLSEVSVYSVYYLVVKGIMQIIQSFSNGIDASWGDMIAKNENKNLNKKFNIYEVIYFSITTLVFTCAMILITPFVSVYTKGITDVNYIRNIFGYLIVISEYIWAIRLPYSSISLAAGHFKETRIGAWVECLVNLVLSVILVQKFGIIGVTIGTIIAMLIRTCEFVYHSNRYILNRSIWKSVDKIFLVIIDTVVIIIISKCIPMINNVNYISWVINAIMIAISSFIIVFITNYVFYRNELKEIFKMFKNILVRKKANQ